MGKYKPFILLGSALIIALITSLLVYSSLQEKRTAKEPPALATQPVAIAMADLAWGTVLQKEMIKTAPYLKESLPDGSFSDIASLTGRVLIFPVKAKEPILESRLAPISIKTGGVAAVISPKKRAIAVRVDKTIGVSGFIRPNNRVDVLVTLSTGKTPAPITKTILENILVKTVGPEIERKGKDEKASDADVITLEVTPEEAEKLALASNEGKIQLTLRSFNDTGDVITKGATIPALLASYSSGTEAKAVTKKPMEGKKKGLAGPPDSVKAKSESSSPAPEKKPQFTVPEKKPQFTVELIKGSNVSTVKFEGGEDE